LPDILPAETTSLRPVTPHGIIAQNLERLRKRAAGLAYADPGFSELLAETTRLATGLEEYLLACSSPESPVRADLAADSARRDWTKLFAAGSTAVCLEAEMVSGHIEGQLLNFLVRATRATRILEIGLFTGYSALAMAEALPSDGRLTACEIDGYAAGIAREWFDRSPHGAKIVIEIGPALATLERLRDDGDRFDFVFIDADKGNYAAYLDLVVGSSLLTADGLICVDNTLMQGEPWLQGPRTPNGEAIAAFNRFVADDPRVEQVVLPVRDGLTLIRRSPS
jgi:caffeoyl-CoA O-methyltransferase